MLLARGRQGIAAEATDASTPLAPRPPDRPVAPVADVAPAPVDSASLGPARIGLLAGVGFPHPIAVEGLARLGGFVAVGADYGVLPSITIAGVDMTLWSLGIDVRAFPLRGPFFVGLRAGRQHVGALTRVSIESLGSAPETLSLDSWFLNPRLGFLWTSQAGLAFGVDAGLQIPLGASVSSTLPLSLNPTAQRTIDTLGKSVLPTVDLLRVGFLL